MGTLRRTGDEDEHTGDRLALQQLVDSGADLSKPRQVRAYLYFANEEAAKPVAEKLAEAGWRVGVGARGSQWLVRPERELILDEYSLAAIRADLHVLAEASAGEYDGWEAAPSP